MSQKRKASTVADLEAANPTSTKKHRPFKPRKPRADDDERTTSANALKGRIRDLKRLLAHVENVPKHKMSAGARIERERELEACEHELADMTARAREGEYRKKMIGKYHQVRFFDRQKATRILKRLKKEQATLSDPSQKTELLKAIHNAEVDVNYAIYHPLMKPYSALYPKTAPTTSTQGSPTSDSDAAKPDLPSGPKGDIATWHAVESAMQAGTLEQLRNSAADVPAAPPKKDWTAKAKAKKILEAEKHRAEKHRLGREEESRKSARDQVLPPKRAPAPRDEEDSDGGFFE